MSRLRPALLFLALSVVAGLVPSAAAAPARAAADDDTAKAKEHFAKARIHYDLKEWDGALQEFKDAYRYVPDPVFLYNIAQCHLKLGHNREAIDFFHNYLRRAPNAPNRADVERRIADLEAVVRAEPPPPSVVAPPTAKPPAVTTAPAAPAPPLPPPPVVTAPPPVTVPPPRAVSTVPAVDLTSPPPAAATSPPLYQRWWFWTGIAVVAAGTVGIIAVAKRGQVGDCMGVPTCRDLRP